MPNDYPPLSTLGFHSRANDCSNYKKSCPDQKKNHNFERYPQRQQSRLHRPSSRGMAFTCKGEQGGDQRILGLA